MLGVSAAQVLVIWRLLASWVTPPQRYSDSALSDATLLSEFHFSLELVNIIGKFVLLIVKLFRLILKLINFSVKLIQFHTLRLLLPHSVVYVGLYYSRFSYFI